MIPFSSRDKNFRSVIGALATGQPLHLRISPPRSIHCSGARLVVVKENETPVRYGMYWAGMHGEDREWWELDFSATTPGLYWYYFELDTPWGVNEITNAGNGQGKLNAAGGAFQLTVYDKNFGTPDWLKGGLIYQIFPDRFYASGAPKTNVPVDRVLRSDWGAEPEWKPTAEGKVLNRDYFGGDLQGIEQKLDYIRDLGVNCIYLNPIFESHSNHRYDTADYLAIDPLLGDEKVFRSLCSAAKKRGIRIVLDGVFSHTGCDSRYFNISGRYDTLGAYNSKESPYYNWYKFINWPNDYQSWWGIALLPELIEENPDFQEFICGKNGVARHWMRCGASGWRLDVADELPDSFLDRFRTAVKEENTDTMVIGEVWEDATTKFAYGQRRRYLQGGQLDSVMNYPFADAVLTFVRSGGADGFVNKVMSIVEHYPPQVLAVLMNHIGTHDTARAITALAGEPCQQHDRSWQSGRILSEEAYARGIQLLKLASLLQYTLPGVPSLYYGDEAGMQGYRDPFNRFAFPWDHIDKELHNWYVQLGQIRKDSPCLAQGEFVPFYAQEDAVVYLRQNKAQTMLVAVNRGDSALQLALPGLWDRAQCVLGNPPVDEMLSLPACSAAVLIK